MLIRPATMHEVPELIELAIRSKGYWGYEQSFLERWRPKLTEDFGEAEMAARISNVLEIDGTLAGFYRLLPQNDDLVLLDDLWLEPQQIGKGLGRILFEDACAVARKSGFMKLTFIAEPYAVPFYLKMGALIVDEVESNVLAGRMLPVMELEL